MNRLKTLLVTIVILGLATTAFSQNIAYHTNNEANTAPFIAALRDAGYTVTVGATWANLDAAGATDLNDNYDLVIIARYSNSANFGSGTGTAVSLAWNTVTTPVLMQSAYNTRNTRAAWFDNGAVSGSQAKAMKIEVPTHPIFFNTLYDASGISNELSDYGHDIPGTTDAGNGVVLTSSPADGKVCIVEWQAPQEHFSGSGATSGHTMFYPLDDKGLEPVLNEEGMLFWLDVVEYMLTGAVSDRSTPTAIHLTDTVFTLNTPLGAVVGNFSATDPQDNAVSYALVAGDGDDDNGLFVIDGTALKLNANLDADADKVLDAIHADSILTIRVEVTDGTGRTFEESLLLAVAPFNDGPADIYLDNASILENQLTGTKVGVLTAYDANGDIKMYELVDGVGADDNSSFYIDGDSLKSDTVFNYEIKNSFTVRIMVTDSTDQSTEKAFTIDIADIDESPTDITLENDTISENLPVGTKIATISGVDPQDDITSFTLAEGDDDEHNTWFYIDGDSLYSNAVFDYEFLDTLSIRIKATDSEGSSYDETFVIDVNDTEDVIEPTVNQQYRIAYAGDATKAAPYIELLTNNGYDVDLDAFWQTNTAEVVDSIASSYDLFIVGRNANSAGFTAEIWNKLTTPILSLSAYLSRGNRGHWIKTNNVSSCDTALAIIDPEHAVFSYVNSPNDTLAGVSTETLRGNLWVQGNGKLLATHVSDGRVSMAEWRAGLPFYQGETVLAGNRMVFNMSDSYGLTERGDSLLLDVVEYIITGSIGAPNEIAIDVDIITENVAIGTVVGTLEALDRHGDVASIAFVEGEGDVDNALFTLEGDILKIAGDINYEVKDMLSIRVQVVDVDGNTFDEIIEFTVQDIPETPYGVELSDTEVTELDEPGVLVGTLIGLDEDEDADMFALVAGEGDSDNGSFEIDTIFSYTYNYYLDSSKYDIDTVFADDNSIVSIDTTYSAIDSTMTDTIPHYEGMGLYTTAIFDYETKNSLSVRVEVTDTTDKTFETVLSVAVLDVNENPTDISYSGNLFTEHNAIGDVIGVLSAEDPQDDFSHFELVVGAGDTHNDMVSIDGNEVKAAVVFEHSTIKLLTIRVKAVDIFGNSYEETLYTVILEDPTTAIENIASGDIMVYPNPSSTGIFKLELNGLGNASIMVTDLTGKVIVRESLHSNNAEINLEGFSRGVYIATIVSNNQVIVKTLIKN